MTQDLAIALLYIVYAMGMLITFGTVLTWVERKQAAVMSDRIGANRAYLRIPYTRVKLVWWGLFHGIADGLKMMLKENFNPRTYDQVAYAIAPWVVFTPVLLVFAVVPFGGTLDPGRLVPALAGWFHGRTYPMQIAPLDGSWKRRSRSISVLLPAPLGPTTAQNSPAPIDSDTSSSAGRPRPAREGYAKVTCSRSMRPQSSGSGSGVWGSGTVSSASSTPKIASMPSSALRAVS